MYFSFNVNKILLKNRYIYSFRCNIILNNTKKNKKTKEND